MPQKNMLDNLEGFVKELFATVIANESEEGHIRFCRLVNDALDVYKAPWLSSWTRTRDKEIEAAQKVFEAFKGSENRLPSLVELISKGTWYQGSFNTILLRTFVAAVPGYQKLESKDEETAFERVKELLLKCIENFQKESQYQQQIAIDRRQNLDTIERKKDNLSEAICITSSDLAKKHAQTNPLQAAFTVNISSTSIELLYYDPYGFEHVLDIPEGLQDLYKNITDRLIKKQRSLDTTHFFKELKPIELRQLKIECVCARDNFLRLISLEHQKDGHEDKMGLFFVENTATKINYLHNKFSSMDILFKKIKVVVEECEKLAKNNISEPLELKKMFSQLVRYYDDLLITSQKMIRELFELSEKLSYIMPEICFDDESMELKQHIDQYNLVALNLDELLLKQDRFKKAGNQDRLNELEVEIKSVKTKAQDTLEPVFRLINNPMNQYRALCENLKVVHKAIEDRFYQDTREDRCWILSYRDVHGANWLIDSEKKHPKLFDFLKSHTNQILDEERSILKALLLDVKTTRAKEITPVVRANLEACYGKPKPKKSWAASDGVSKRIEMNNYKAIEKLYKVRSGDNASQPQKTALLDTSDGSAAAKVAGLFGARFVVTKQYQHSAVTASQEHNEQPEVGVYEDVPPAPPPPKF